MTRKGFEHNAFVGVVRVGMKETHGDRGVVSCRNIPHQRLDRIRIERAQDVALRRHAFRQREAVLARHQGLGQAQVQVVLLETVLGPHLDHVAEALGRDESHARAGSLDQRVGDESGAVDDLSQVGKRHASRVRREADAFQDRIFGPGIVGQDLRRRAPARMIENDVREGAADVDAAADHRRPLANWCAAKAVS